LLVKKVACKKKLNKGNIMNKILYSFRVATKGSNKTTFKVEFRDIEDYKVIIDLSGIFENKFLKIMKGEYSFRYLDKKEVERNINKRISFPYLINQQSTSLCGIASIAYIFAKSNSTGYNNFITNMHKKGIALIDQTGYKVEIDNDEHLVELKPQNKKVGSLEFADYLFLATIRDFKNILWDYDTRKDDSKIEETLEGCTGISFPHIISGLMKDVLNFKNILYNQNHTKNYEVIVFIYFFTVLKMTTFSKKYEPEIFERELPDRSSRSYI
jgi:hypothetical protein